MGAPCSCGSLAQQRIQAKSLLRILGEGGCHGGTRGETDAFENGRRVSLKMRMPSQALDVNKLLTTLPGEPVSFNMHTSFV